MRLLAIFVCFSLFIIQEVDSDQREFNQKVNKMANEIVANYLQKYTCISYIFEDEDGEIRLRDNKSVFLVRLMGDSSDELLLTESFEQGCGGYLIRIHSDKLTMVERLIAAKRKALRFRYNNQRYLFLPKDENDTNTDFLLHRQMFFMPNIIVAIPKGEGFTLMSHTQFNRHKHEALGIAREVVDEWTSEGNFTLGNDLYPDRTKNVMGRKFVFALLHYAPFAVILRKQNKTKFDGFETRIAAQFVETVNGTWDGLDHPVELWGDLYPNDTATGVLGSVLRHDADFGYAAFYQWYCDDLDCSYPFYQSGVTCVVPKPKLMPGWLTIVLPLAPNTWLALISFYFISTLFVLFLLLSLMRLREIDIYKNIKMAVSDAFFTGFRLQLEQIPKISKSKKPLSVYINISVYYYFFVAAFWQAEIASILTVPRYEKPINDVIDLLENWPEIEWGANSCAWTNSIKYSSDPHLIELVKKFKVLQEEELAKRTKTGDFGFFVEKLTHGRFGFNSWLNEDSIKYLRVMQNNIYSAFGVMILPKGSPFSERFDRTVLWMYDTGLIHKLEVQTVIDLLNNRIQSILSSPEERDKTGVILAIRHIQGPLCIYAFGILTSTLAFLGEKFIMKPKNNHSKKSY